MEWELSPVVHESISQFSAMNDDCLLALFKPLNFFDSVALANTCTRMMALFREHGICDKMLDFTTLKQRFINWLDVFEYMLVGYGSQLRHLSIDNYTYARSLDQVLFNMINKYCSAGNLRSLSFEGMEIGKSFVRNSTVVLNNLRSLNITHCRINDGCLAELLANCPKLEHLKLEKYDIRYGTRLLNPLLSIVSPHLRSITMSSCHVDIAPDTLRLVLAKTPKLETFVYREVSMPQHNDNPYDVIAEMLPNLKKFTYNVRSDQRICWHSPFGCLAIVRESEGVAAHESGTASGRLFGPSSSERQFAQAQHGKRSSGNTSVQFADCRSQSSYFAAKIENLADAESHRSHHGNCW